MREKRIGLDGALRVEALDSASYSEFQSSAAFDFDIGAFNNSRRSAIVTLLPQGCQ